MPRKLTDDERRLRKLKDGELADELGQLQAKIAGIRTEAIRRGLRRAEGLLFSLVMTPPSQHHRLDRKGLELKLGADVVKPFLTTVLTDWVMRCYPRKRAASS